PEDFRSGGEAVDLEDVSSRLRLDDGAIDEEHRSFGHSRIDRAAILEVHLRALQGDAHPVLHRSAGKERRIEPETNPDLGVAPRGNVPAPAQDLAHWIERELAAAH